MNASKTYFLLLLELLWVIETIEWLWYCNIFRWKIREF